MGADYYKELGLSKDASDAEVGKLDMRSRGDTDAVG